MFTRVKIAHLILTHANPAQLERLLGKLDHEDAHVYIHLDLKTAIQPFLHLANDKKVFFINNRVKVAWGGFTIVEATLNGFAEILASGRSYDYINLLSGQDYPIKSAHLIHDFFAKNTGKIFMHTLSVDDEWHEAKTRITEYHFVNHQFPGRYRLQQLVNAIMPKRKLPDGIKAMGRSQWFTASWESIAYVLDYIKTNGWVKRFFRYSWAADELIFQTILYNSPFKADIVNDNLRYIDWSEKKASPKLLTMDDAPALLASEKLFARKFNMDVDKKILDYLDEKIS